MSRPTVHLAVELRLLQLVPLFQASKTSAVLPGGHI